MNPMPAFRFVLRAALQNILRNRGIAFASLLTVALVFSRAINILG